MNNILKEYSQEIPNYPTYKFYFPEDLGEYIKKSDYVFEIKKGNVQKIRVMISKCKSEADLESDAKKWIEKNKVDAKMEDVSYRKEKINSIPIEVYELRTIEKKEVKIYKIGYVNGCRITISGWNVNKKEEVINAAFEKITWIDDTKNNDMEEFVKLYSQALEKKVEKICNFLKRHNSNEALDRMNKIKENLNDINNVGRLIDSLGFRALRDYYFEPKEENDAWVEVLDFNDLPVYPHYCRLKLMEYKDKSIEESLVSSLNILLKNAREVNNEKLCLKIDETILNINDIDYLKRFKKNEDWLKHIGFENFENGTIKYRDFLWDLFIEVDTLIQKINDNNNPPYNNSELMDNIKRIIEAEESEEELNFVDYDNGCILKSTKMDITIETKDSELMEYAKKLYEEYENNLMSIAKYMVLEEFSSYTEEEIIDKLGKANVRIVNKNSADFSYEENSLEENYIISFEVTNVYEEYDYLTIDG